MPTEAWLNFKALIERLETLLKEAPAMDSDARLHRLMVLLNELELCYLAIDLVEPTEDRINGPDYTDTRRQQVTAAFPELGYYNSIWTSPATEIEEAVIGDAADDLIEIFQDIDYALWAERRANWIDGAFEARFMYQAHTGWHLVNLRSHLYNLRFNSRTPP